MAMPASPTSTKSGASSCARGLRRQKGFRAARQRLDRRAGLVWPSARLLPQQYGELARADRERRQGRREFVHSA
jgi:hypothetical protein